MPRSGEKLDRQLPWQVRLRQGDRGEHAARAKGSGQPPERIAERQVMECGDGDDCVVPRR
jgi:hypothetical protein